MKQTFKMMVMAISLLTIFAPKKSFAQVPDTSTVQKLIQYIFQPVNKTQVPSGILEEYGCPILPASTFNGTLSDRNKIDMNLWYYFHYG